MRRITLYGRALYRDSSVIRLRRPSSVHSLLSENDPPSLYFATEGGVKLYSVDTSSEVTVVANSSTWIFGVAFDWLRDKIYWSSHYKVFRANSDGTEVKTVLDSDQCKSKLCSFVN